MISTFLALTLLAQGAESTSPTWMRDYTQAQKQAQAEKKPLAVFLTADAQTPNLSPEVQKLLAQTHVTVQIDTSNKVGMDWAHAFEIKSGQGVVLSDREGNFQTYWNEGAPVNAHLLARLGTQPISTVSYYPPTDAPTTTAPATYSTVNGTVINGSVVGGVIVSPSTSTLLQPSSYCPNCQNGGTVVRRR